MNLAAQMGLNSPGKFTNRRVGYKCAIGGRIVIDALSLELKKVKRSPTLKLSVCKMSTTRFLADELKEMAEKKQLEKAHATYNYIISRLRTAAEDGETSIWPDCLVDETTIEMLRADGFTVVGFACKQKCVCGREGTCSYHPQKKVYIGTVPCDKEDANYTKI